MSEDPNAWRNAPFRQSIVSKIDEAIRVSGMSTSRNSMEMEKHVFLKAKTKEEYLGYVARLILHVRDLNKKGPQQQAPGMPPDPINALQNLASQGTRNAMVNMGGPPQPGQLSGPGGQGPTNIHPSLMRNQQNLSQQVMMGGGGGGGGMPMQVVPRMQNMNNMANNQMAGQIPMQMANQMSAQQMAQQMQMQGGPVGPMVPGNMQMVPGNMQGPINSQMMASMQQQLQQAKVANAPNGMLLNPNMMGGGGYVRQNNAPGQMFAHSPLQSNAPSPAPGLQQQSSVSPAMAPSPGSQMGMMMGTRGQCSMVASPGASLNTPGQSIQSPMSCGGTLPDEQAYREKIRQLSKYVEPLRKMITRIGNDDVEKMSKMKKLLEILSNPHQRMPLDTLIKCEIVLEKIDFKRSDGGLSFKEPHVFHSLLDAVSQNLQSPVINHTLHRTFGPTLDALFGPEFKLVPPLKKAKIEEPTSDIPDVLQGEIARLDQRFKVSLDSNQPSGSKGIQLTCWLDDKHLPCVPPISLTVPVGYPKESPTCHMAPNEYNATKFLSDVQDALLARIKKLPKHFSVSHLLDTWEMSVRQASAPKGSAEINSFALLLGL